jgi:hypothetical protein
LADTSEKEVIMLPFKFKIDCWTARNSCEQSSEEDPIQRRKEKLIQGNYVVKYKKKSNMVPYCTGRQKFECRKINEFA